MPFSAAWGGSPITVVGLRVNAVRGGDGDNVSDIVTRLRGKRTAEGAVVVGWRIVVPRRRCRACASRAVRSSVQDSESGLSLKIAGVAGLLAPGVRRRCGCAASPACSRSRAATRGRASAPTSSTSRRCRRGCARRACPRAREGRLRDAAADAVADRHHRRRRAAAQRAAAARRTRRGRGVVIDLHGSYGGAREDPVDRQGHAAADQPRGAPLAARRAVLARQDRRRAAAVGARRRRAPRSTPPSISPGRGDVVRFGGDLAVSGLQPAARRAVERPDRGRVAGARAARASPTRERRRIELELLEGRVRDLMARVTGIGRAAAREVQVRRRQPPGVVPKIDLDAQPCRACRAPSCWRASRPRSRPSCEGFVLQGIFEAQVGTKIDFATLDVARSARQGRHRRLQGRQGARRRDGARERRADRRDVEVPQAARAGHGAGETETLQFVVGPDNPDFAPYDRDLALPRRRRS